MRCLTELNFSSFRNNSKYWPGNNHASLFLFILSFVGNSFSLPSFLFVRLKFVVSRKKYNQVSDFVFFGPRISWTKINNQSHSFNFTVSEKSVIKNQSTRTLNLICFIVINVLNLALNDFVAGSWSKALNNKNSFNGLTDNLCDELVFFLFFKFYFVHIFKALLWFSSKR